MPIRQLTLINIGENAIFRMETTDRELPLITLRLHRANRRPPAEIEAELKWVAVLYANGLPVPRPLP